MNRSISSALLALTVALCGCSPAPSHEHEFRVALPIDPTSLSPLLAFSQDQIALDLYWCQTLIGLDERNRIIPILLTRVPSHANGDISADGLRITYHLRPDVRFADGVALTSADVAFTYRAILEPANGAPSADNYRDLASLATPDARTVVVRLRKPWSAAVNVLFAQADFAYGILPKHAFTTLKIADSAWGQHPFGTGPFRVAAWRRGDSIELEPNPYYLPKPKLKRLLVRIVPDATTAFNALRTHEIDAAELSPDNISVAAGIGGLRVVRTPVNGLRALYLQTTATPTNSVHVRRAIAYAIDARAVSKAWRDVYPTARSVFPAPLISWRADQPKPYPHDLALAGRELDAAGWRLRTNVRMKNGQPLTLVAAFSVSPPEAARIAVAVQAQLAPLGIGVTIKPYSTTVFVAPDGPLRTGRFSFTPSRFIGGSDPEQSLNLLCSMANNGGQNYSRFCSPELDALFDRQVHATSDVERDRIFDTIAKLIRDEVPLIPLYNVFYIEGVDTRVTAYRRNMLYFPVHPEEWDAR